MDIIDILMAKSLQPDSQAATAAQEAKVAAKEAKDAAEDLADAIALATNIPQVTVTNSNNSSAVSSTITIQDNSGTSTATYKNYKQDGDNEDGSMTQKAIKTYVNRAISSIPSGGGSGGSGSMDLGEENAGKIVVVGEDGQPQAGTVTEKSIIQSQIDAGTYVVTGAYGLKIDYINKVFTRDQDARGINDFSNQPIYNQIRRCLVDDNGEIICFDDDDLYEDNYSTGYQTMVYIPKFYYLRVPLSYEDGLIKQEELFISATSKPGFQIHPAFINENNEQVEYILVGAYESTTYNVATNMYNLTDASGINFSADKLASVAGAKPISGVNNDLTVDKAEQLAYNRGEGWHINSLRVISAIQMLAMMEYGSMNIQDTLNPGVCELSSGSMSVNSAVYTGATASLKHTSGRAETTYNVISGQEYTYSEDGKCSVSYRGIENLWGNMWDMIGGLKVQRDALDGRLKVYICKTLDYENGDYQTLSYYLPIEAGWISSFGYDAALDWVYIPTNVSGGTNKVPVGDYIWIAPQDTEMKLGRLGGHWGLRDNDGIFTYGFDNPYTSYQRSMNSRLTYIPIKNQAYYSNLQE